MDIEFKVFRDKTSFDDVSCYDIEENTIFEFNNFIVSKGGKKDPIRLDGTWMVITLPPDYFHFLKEYFGSILFYKKHVSPDLKILVVDLNYEDLKYHTTKKVNLNILTKLAKESKDIVYINFDEFWNENIIIEKLALIYDGSKVLVNDAFPYFDQTRAANVKVLREYMQPLMKFDHTKPKKIFITRKLVSKVLEEQKRFDHISRYNPEWLENAIEDFFIKNGYTIIELSNMSLENQVSYFYNADYIAGQIGNGMINSIFAKETTNFIYLRTHEWFAYPYFNDASRVFDIKYNVVDIFKTTNYEEAYSLVEKKTKDLDF